MASPSKRARTGDVAPSTSQNEEELAHLASYCDDKLHEFCEDYINAEGTDTNCERSPLADYAGAANAAFEEFVNDLCNDQTMGVDESKKEGLASAWRECAVDAARVAQFRALLLDDSHFSSMFTHREHANWACQSIEKESEEMFDEWRFNLGWTLAQRVLDIATYAESEEEHESDEPVEESDSENSSDEEEEEEESDASSSSEDEEETARIAAIGAAEDGDESDGK